MNDTERIDALERLVWSERCGAGIAIFPVIENTTAEGGITLMDLGNEDGSHLGEDLSEAVPTLREAIDLAVQAESEGAK